MANLITVLERAGQVALQEACQIAGGDATAAAALASGGQMGLRERLYRDFVEQCGRVPDPMLGDAMLLSIMIRSYAEVRDDISIPDLAFETTGLTPTGVAANGAATTFVAGIAVNPGQSTLLRTQAYSLPSNPRCLWGVLRFNAGDPEINYQSVNFKVWVGPRDLSTLSTLIGSVLREWMPRRFIYGSQFHCGTGCQEVALRSYTGCRDIDIVGIESALYLQVDNLAGAANNITGQQIVLKLGGFIEPCCNGCATGSSCGCGGHKH